MDALQQIVRVMSPAEKRYFKLFANAFHENTDLVKLFTVLDTDKAIDDDTVKKKTGIKNLAVSRSNLRKLILKAMRVFSENSQLLQLRSMITDMEWLEGKGLREESLKEMRRAEKLAGELELYSTFIETAQMKRRSIDAKDPDDFTQAYEKLINDTENYGPLSADFTIAMMFNSYVVNYINITSANSTINITNKLQDLLQKGQQRLAKTQTQRGRILILCSLEIIYSKLAQLDEAYNSITQALKIYDENPHLKESPVMMYLIILNSYCGMCGDMARFDEWAEGIKKLTKAYHEQAVPRIDKQALWKMNGVLLCQRVKHAQLTGSTQFIQNIEPEMLAFADESVPVVFPEVLTAIILHYTGYLIKDEQLERAAEWLNRFYQNKYSKQARINYLAARLLEIILFYEQKDFDLAETKAINLYKTIMDLPLELQGEHQKTVGVLLRRLCQWQPGNKADKEDVQNWLNSIQDLIDKQNAFIKQLFVFFDITGWLKKKLI